MKKRNHILFAIAALASAASATAAPKPETLYQAEQNAFQEQSRIADSMGPRPVNFDAIRKQFEGADRKK